MCWENITYLKQRYESLKVHVAKYDQSVQDVIVEQEKVIKLQEEIISNVFDPFLFQRLVVDIKAKFPTITNILGQLVLSPNVSRNVIRT